MPVCYLCGSLKELRPYGPNWKYVCFDCAMKPENKATTERMFSMQLDAAGPIAVIDGSNVGPYPFKLKEEPKP